MKRAVFILILGAGMILPSVTEADPETKLYTPKPGTPVRKAISDAMRNYARQQSGIDPRIKFLWKIDSLRVLDNYACFEGHAVQPDGSYLEDDSAVGDFVQMTFLRRNKDGWWVIADLTRSDVPAAEELKEIRGRFPAEIPTALIPEYWKKKLR